MGLISAAYFDASGERKGYRFLTVAGASSPVDKWIIFEHQWSGVLKDEGVSEFHATDFAASQGEYKEWKGDKLRRSAFIKRLAKIIKDSVHKLYIVTIEIPIWAEIDREYMLSEFFHSPYALAGFKVTGDAVKWATKRKAVPLEVFFESGDEGWGGLKRLCEEHIHFTPEQLSKKKNVAFQVGDFFAWKTRITATNSLKIVNSLQSGDTLKELRRELNSLNRLLVCPGHNGIYTQRNLVKICQGLKVAKRPVTTPIK
jgi:hypothetical protein